MQTFRWGILAPGRIAGQFAEAVTALPDAAVAAVGSRDLGRAEAFAARHAIPRAYGSYAALVADPDLDAIYVASPHSYHRDHVLLALAAGKPVLCEKPLGATLEHAAAMIAAARRANLFLMEALWTRFLPALSAARGWMDAGRIGPLRRLDADFSFRCGWNPESRLLNPELAGGGLLDVGVYVLSLAQWAFGSLPDPAASSAAIGKTGVDEQAAIIFQWPDGAQAVLTCGVRTPGTAHARLAGTDGSIEIPSFFSAQEAILRAGGAEERVRTPHLKNGFEYEIAEAMACIRKGLLESPVLPWRDTLRLAEVSSGLIGQWGVRYPF
ncbi:MAG: Gfo/Idh/MocA family oxidoreductase [Lentisphaerae bacterium]|nr:Gfo/Idh/MocA family oxidoreductase [Lentisphaerota bacterium]